MGRTGTVICGSRILAIFVFLTVLEWFVELIIATKYLSQIFQEARLDSITYWRKTILLIILDTTTIPMVSSSSVLVFLVPPVFPAGSSHSLHACWFVSRPPLLPLHVFYLCPSCLPSPCVLPSAPRLFLGLPEALAVKDQECLCSAGV